MTICERDDPRDAFVSNRYASIDELPAGSVVGTSVYAVSASWPPRRPDLAIRSLRGNVGTRLSKLDNGEYDAIIRRRRPEASAAGSAYSPAASPENLCRRSARARSALNAVLMMHGPGAVSALNHTETAVRVRAERAMNTRLEGGCQVPIGSYAELKDGELWLRRWWRAGRFADGARRTTRASGRCRTALGISLAEELLDNGAREILAAVYDGEAPR